MAKQLTNTPTGVLTGFVAIEKPSTKFDDTGVYSCQVAFTGKDAVKMEGIIDGLMSGAAQIGLSKDVKRSANPPYTMENKTLTVKFKQKARISSKTGQVYEMNIKLYDAKGVLIEQEIGLGTGSLVKVAFSAYSWAVASLGAGITLQPVCIQVIKLVKYAGGSSNPFEAEEGYTAAVKNDQPFGDTDDTTDDNDF